LLVIFHDFPGAAACDEAGDHRLQKSRSDPDDVPVGKKIIQERLDCGQRVRSPHLEQQYGGFFSHLSVPSGGYHNGSHTIASAEKNKGGNRSLPPLLKHLLLPGTT